MSLLLGAALLLVGLGNAGLFLVANLILLGSVLIQTLLAEFLLTLVNVRVQLVTVLPNRELLVVVDRNLNFLGAVRLVVWVMELGNVLVF